jgi:hypothetical protein
MTRTAFRDGRQYLLLEAGTKGLREDRVIGMRRLGLEPELRGFVNEFGLKLAETAKEDSDHSYIDNINWKQAISLPFALRAEALTLPEFWGVYRTLEEGMNGRRVYNGLGKKVNERQIRVWHDEWFGKRGPQRGVWIDALFFEKNGALYIKQNHRIREDGLLVAGMSAKLKKHCEISWGLIDISSVNEQGLWTRISDEGKIYGYSPVKNSVAWFYANSGGAGLGCDGDPTYSDSSLGVIASATREHAPFL